MMVNPFWFGFLMAYVLLIAIALVFAIIGVVRSDREPEEVPPEEYREIVKNLSGKKYRFVERDDGNLELVEESDNENNDK